MHPRTAKKQPRGWSERTSDAGIAKRDGGKRKGKDVRETKAERELDRPEHAKDKDEHHYVVGGELVPENRVEDGNQIGQRHAEPPAEPDEAEEATLFARAGCG